MYMQRETYDKVNLKVRLAVGAERVLAAVLRLVIAILLVLFETLINTREGDELQETRTEGSIVVLPVGRNGTIMLGSRAKEVVIETKTILDLEDMGQDRVVLEVSTDVLRVNNALDAESLEIGLDTNTGQHEDLGGLIDALSNDNLTVSVKVVLAVIGPNNGDTDGSLALKNNLLRDGRRGQSDVGLTLKERSRGRSDTLVDRVDTLEETLLNTIVDVDGHLVALANPSPFEGITPRLQLGDQIGVRNIDGTTLVADAANIVGEETKVVVVSRRLVEVVLNVFPVPSRTTKLLPVVEGCGRASNPSIVIERGTATQHLATGVRFLNTSVVWAVDHGRFIPPVVLRVSQTHGLCRGGDVADLRRIAGYQLSLVGNARIKGKNSLYTGLDKKYRHVWVLGKTAGNGATAGAASKNDEIEVFGRIFGMSSSVDHIANEYWCINA